MNSFRQALVCWAYDQIDAESPHPGFGEAVFDNMVSRYNARDHADVKAGRADALEVLQRFLRTFNNRDPAKVTQQEFLNYYMGVSAGIESDSDFEQVIRSAWRLSGEIPGGSASQGRWTR